MNEKSQAAPPADEFALVEIFGHRRHYGKISDVERFGARMIRIDVPLGPKPDPAEYEIFETYFYGGAAIFSVSPLTEEACRKFAERYRPHTALPRLAASYRTEFEDDEPDDLDDEE